MLADMQVYCGQDCLSCSSIENANDCHHHITCNDNEVCYKHKYTGESGSITYDVGCGLKSVCTTLPRECSDISSAKTGVYNIFPDGSPSAVPVYCVVNNEGSWTVIQRRFNGQVNFYRGWEAYKEGFGNGSGEYWLGNENIHELTSHGRHALRVELASFDNTERYAEYSLFSVGDEQSSYQLIVKGYHGSAGDSLKFHDDEKFSTYDRDNDKADSNCAVEFAGGWWYYSCYHANLNGKYRAGKYDGDCNGNTWNAWLGCNYALKSSIMMIQKRS
ncbi:Hypothetical predicted protein [Mytilus galloprovincialis]|uniref:Fibrinogen C-terminal domain-containing protein n=1 Tax=Mytilus galloprovincialis TaxID=29158 RepID=A0A8B6DS28_MYTGA|nr:Hypothetical predicted protein [Mytilus galloprovincialis]